MWGILYCKSNDQLLVFVLVAIRYQSKPDRFFSVFLLLLSYQFLIVFNFNNPFTSFVFRHLIASALSPANVPDDMFLMALDRLEK